MFAKRLLQKATQHHHHHHHHLQSRDTQQSSLNATDFNPQIVVHYGIASTSSILAFDPIQGLLAIGTLDGRIKVIRGDNVEGLLISPKQLPYRFLEFLQNQGFLVAIPNDDDIQVWNLETRCMDCCLQWKSNITSFSVIHGSYFILIGDEYGRVSVLKYDVESGELLQLPYQISASYIAGKAGIPFLEDQPIVGVLPQPGSSCNRMAIAYQNGLIVLWDFIEARIVLVKGDKDLAIKFEVSDSPSNMGAGPSDDAVQKLDEKEISALCWASSCGSILAVGYTDGDIFLWNLSEATSLRSNRVGLSCNNIVKLQLSSSEKRLPVIVLHWNPSVPNSSSQGSGNGQLFIYGGDEVGSEEVVTVVFLQWSSGMDSLRHVRRVDLTMGGSFADMVLLSSDGALWNNHSAGVFVLTNPGKLLFYDKETLSSLASQQERKPSVFAIESPIVVPTLQMTVAKLIVLPSGGGHLSVGFQEIDSVASTMGSAEGSKNYPLTGGIPSGVSSSRSTNIQRVYMAGYQDGSVQIWDATSPVLYPIHVLQTQVLGIEAEGSSAAVSTLDFCSHTLNLAVGKSCGLVYVYSLKNGVEVSKLQFIRDSKCEVLDVHQKKGPPCRAVFNLLNSPIRSLKFAESGARLAVGYESGHVAVLDMNSLAVMFLTDSVVNSGHPAISVIFKSFTDVHHLVKSSKFLGSMMAEHPPDDMMLTMTNDGKVRIFDGKSGAMISSRPLQLKKKLTAMYMYVIGSNVVVPSFKRKQPEQPEKSGPTMNEPIQHGSQLKDQGEETLHPCLDEERIRDVIVLLCCRNALRLYTLKSVLQGEDRPIHKVKLSRVCCWTATFKKDDKGCGLVLLYESGILEIRSLPDLESIAESSLMSILRWSFRPNMDRLMSSTDNGQISLLNGCELAFISLAAGENDLRILESQPCLHDKVVAAAASAVMKLTANQKKQAAGSGILGGIIKGFKKEKQNHTNDPNIAPQSELSKLDDIFSRLVISDQSLTSAEDNGVEELDIDDIEIDETEPLASTSSQNAKSDAKSERDRLLGGVRVDTKPRRRTHEEIMAAYGRAADASSAAADARNKLVQRQERLEKMNQRTEELRAGAEDFASLANELVKTMEKRKWWNI